MWGLRALLCLLLCSFASTLHVWGTSTSPSRFPLNTFQNGPGPLASDPAFAPSLVLWWRAAERACRCSKARPSPFGESAAWIRTIVARVSMSEAGGLTQTSDQEVVRETVAPPPLSERIQRKFKDISAVESAKNPLKLVTYNVLGPVQGMSAKHAYCKRDYRYWSYRKELIFDEISGYSPHVVCLQEVTPETYKDDFEPFFRARGYKQSFYQPKRHPVGSAEAKREAQFRLRGKRGRSGKAVLHTCLGTATFVHSAWRVVKSERMVLNTKLSMLAIPKATAAPEKPTKREASGESKRQRRRDRGKTKGVPMQVSPSFGTSLKKLADTAILTLLEPQGGGNKVLVANVHLYWNPKRPDIKTAQSVMLCRGISQFLGCDTCDTALVVCGDFNSVRHLQEQYVKAEALLQGKGEGLSGVWAVLADGRLSALHPEHPAGFGTSPGLEDLESGLPRLRNVYEEHGMYPVMTTKTDTFTGTIDHIWCSRNLDVRELLEMPFGPPSGREPTTLPNVCWGSDHLAIGATVTVT